MEILGMIATIIMLILTAIFFISAIILNGIASREENEFWEKQEQTAIQKNKKKNS